MSSLPEREKISVTPSKKNELNPFVLIFAVIAIVTILTYIVPSGQYERIELDGRSVVDPSTFEFVGSSPVGLLEMFNSLHVGMTEAAPITMYLFLFAGALGIMKATGVISSLVIVVSNRYGSKDIIFVPALVLIFAILGTLIGAAEDMLIFIGIIVPVAIRMGFDAITGFAIVMLGTLSTGFISGITNPYNVGVAQGIAELPIYSGMGLRIGLFLVFFILSIVYILRHARKVKRDPSLAEYGSFSKEMEIELTDNLKLDKRQVVSLIILLLSFIGLVVGVIQLDWYIGEIAGLFLFSGVLIGFIGRLSVNEMADGFVSGAREVVAAALIIGFAYTISVVLTAGGLIDTILYYAQSLLGDLPAVINAVGMFVIQLIINFFVPSGSGQAAMTMPIMAPLADIVGVTRQTAVLAFQLGDGVANLLFPTSVVLLPALAIAGIPVSKWIKWILPFFFIQVIISIVFIVIAQTIQYGPF